MRRSRTLSLDRSGHVGSEYQVISILPSWGAMSLSSAVLALLSRPILAKVLFGWLSWRPSAMWSWPLAVAAGSVAAASLGLAAGIIGYRRRKGSRTLVVVGILANAAVLALVIVFNGLVAYIRMR